MTKPTTVQGVPVPKLSTVFLREDSTLKAAWFYHDITIQGYPCAGSTWSKTSTGCHPNGRLRYFFPRKTLEIQGFPVKPGGLAGVYFYASGKPGRFYLNKDIEINGRVYKKGLRETTPLHRGLFYLLISSPVRTFWPLITNGGNLFMKLLFAACILVALSGMALAAERTPLHGLGFAAGQTSGIGLSYRKMSDNYGFQVTLGAMSQSYDSWESDYYRSGDAAIDWVPSTKPFTEKYYLRETDANLGILLFKVLHSAKRSRFYAFVGGSVFYNIDTFEEYTYEYQLQADDTYIMHEISGPKKSTESRSTIYGGVGIGIEFRITQNIRVAVEWPLTLSSEGDFVMYMPQTGLHYFF